MLIPFDRATSIPCFTIRIIRESAIEGTASLGSIELTSGEILAQSVEQKYGMDIAHNIQHLIFLIYDVFIAEITQELLKVDNDGPPLELTSVFSVLQASPLTSPLHESTTIPRISADSDVESPGMSLSNYASIPVTFL
jgi:hypothetical protein